MAKKAATKKTAKRAAAPPPSVAIVITPPNMQTAVFRIVGTAPYVQHKFSAKSRRKMLEQQMKSGGAKGKKKEPRNPQEEYEGALHIGEDGRYGIPAAAFRCAMIDACRAAGFVMTKAKMSIAIEADTVDADEGIPLVHIEGEPEMNEAAVRLESGVASIAFRPMWRQWAANVRVKWDADQFGAQDVANLLMRAGMQVGVGEGRMFSKKSNGMGWGLFELAKG